MPTQKKRDVRDKERDEDMLSARDEDIALGAACGPGSRRRFRNFDGDDVIRQFVKPPCDWDVKSAFVPFSFRFEPLSSSVENCSSDSSKAIFRSESTRRSRCKFSEERNPCQLVPDIRRGPGIQSPAAHFSSIGSKWFRKSTAGICFSLRARNKWVLARK